MSKSTTVYFQRRYQPDGAVVRTAKAIPDELTIQGNDGEDRTLDGVSIISPTERIILTQRRATSLYSTKTEHGNYSRTSLLSKKWSGDRIMRVEKTRTL